MTFIQDIIDVFLGDANWQQRVKPTIQMVSPEGNEFEAKWIGGQRSYDKKLGIFMYPKVKGNVVQDLDVNSTIYPLTIYFDGADSDIIASTFFLACKERGVWQVEHPVHGAMTLQLMSITQNDEPVTSGGITAMETEWIEPIDPDNPLTAAALAAQIADLSNQLDDSALSQFVDAVNDASETLQATIEQTVQGVQNVADFVFSPLTALVDAVDNTFNTIQNGITDTLNATALQATALGGQIQQLVQTPLFASNDIRTRKEVYEEFNDEIFSGLSTTPDAKNKNAVAVQELALSSSITSTAKIATTGIQTAQAGAPIATGVQKVTTATPITSRAQAVEFAIKASEVFENITNQLDAVQSAYSDAPIETQYFSQSK